MPEKRTLERASRDARQGKAASTQAGEFVKEEMDHIREGKHGARSTKQAIAIGLSKARRSGVKLGPPKAGNLHADAQASRARPGEGRARNCEEGFGERSTRGQRGVEARRAKRGIARSAIEASAFRGAKANYERYFLEAPLSRWSRCGKRPWPSKTARGDVVIVVALNVAVLVDDVDVRQFDAALQHV